jgi:hypothetical protein
MSSILILGPSGSGKTRSFTTLPGSLAVAEFDPSGERSIRRKITYFDPGDADKIDEANLPEDEVAVIRYLSIQKSITKEFRLDSKQLNQKRMLDLFILDTNVLLKDSKIQNIAIDTLTGLSRIAKGACFAGAGTKGPTYRDWDLFAEKVLEIIEVAQGNDEKNLIVTGHLQTEKDAVTEAIKETPYAEGQKISRTIMQSFDVVYLAIYRDGKYVWRTKPTETLQSIRNRLVDGNDLEEYIPQHFGDLLKVLPKKVGD